MADATSANVAAMLKKFRADEATKRCRRLKKIAGLCTRCSDKAVENQTLCEVHRLESNVRIRESSRHCKEQIAQARRIRMRRTYQDRKKDLAFVLRERLRLRILAAIKREPTAKKAAKTESLVGCTVEFLRGHIESLFVDGMNWENRHLWHIDHIKPCSKFDLTQEEEQRKCFHYTNLQPLWAKDNILKSNKEI